MAPHASEDMNGNSEVPVTNDQPQNGVKVHPEEYYYGDTAKPGAAYSVLEQYHSKPTKLRVACIGAGASGLCLAYKMERQLVPGSWELTLFEKNPHFGGTWYENTYPGVACDVSQSSSTVNTSNPARSPLTYTPSLGTLSLTGVTTLPMEMRFKSTSRILPSDTDRNNT